MASDQLSHLSEKFWKLCECEKGKLQHPDGRNEFYCLPCNRVMCERQVRDDHRVGCRGVERVPGERPENITVEAVKRLEIEHMVSKNLGGECDCPRFHLPGYTKRIYFCASAKCDEAFCSLELRNHACEQEFYATYFAHRVYKLINADPPMVGCACCV